MGRRTPVNLTKTEGIELECVAGRPRLMIKIAPSGSTRPSGREVERTARRTYSSLWHRTARPEFASFFRAVHNLLKVTVQIDGRAQIVVLFHYAMHV